MKKSQGKMRKYFELNYNKNISEFVECNNAVLKDKFIALRLAFKNKNVLKINTLNFYLKKLLKEKAN